METTNLHYLQVPFNGLPAGTPLLETEPSSAQVFANALVHRDKEPARYFSVVGQVSENDVMRIPSFKGIVGEVHPQDKTVIGPFVAGDITFDYDNLGKGVHVLITAKRNYPFVEVKVIIDPRLTYADIVFALETSDLKDGGCDIPYGVGLDLTVMPIVDAILFSDKVEPVPGFKMDSSVRELMPLVVNKGRFITD